MDYLYKIMPLEKQRVDAVTQCKLWFSQAESFNDPFDCGIEPTHTGDFELEELEEYLNDLAFHSPMLGNLRNSGYWTTDKENRNHEVHQALVANLKKMGVFSALASEKNIVTWSHYGDSHKGFCARYKVDWSTDACFKRQANGFAIHQVSYSNKMPFCDMEDVFKAPRFVVDTLLTTKYKDWAYEDEIRIISHKEKGNKLIPLNKMGLELDKVFMGCRADKADTNYKKLASFCDKNSIDLVNLRHKKYSFELEAQATYK